MLNHCIYLTELTPKTFLISCFTLYPIVTSHALVAIVFK